MFSRVTRPCLDGVPRQGITLTGYQYNLAGELRPVPREQYRDRAMPLHPSPYFPRAGRDALPLAGMAFLPWQDGGVVLLQGKLPLEGMLVFLGGVISDEEFRKIQKMTWGDCRSQVSCQFLRPISLAASEHPAAWRPRCPA